MGRAVGHVLWAQGGSRCGSQELKAWGAGWDSVQGEGTAGAEVALHGTDTEEAECLDPEREGVGHDEARGRAEPRRRRGVCLCPESHGKPWMGWHEGTLLAAG